MQKIHFIVVALIVVAVTIIHLCAWASPKPEIKTQTITVQGHCYIVFKYPRNSNIAVIHSENCHCKKLLIKFFKTQNSFYELILIEYDSSKRIYSRCKEMIKGAIPTTALTN